MEMILKNKMTLLFFSALLLIMPRDVLFAKGKCKYDNVRIYASEKSYNPFLVIGVAILFGSDLNDVLCDIKKMANKLNGDAVIKFELQGENGSLFDKQYSYLAKGIIIREVLNDPKALTQIRPTTPLPIMEVR